MARFIKCHEFQGRKGFVYIDEYATYWRVSAKEYCAEFPCVDGWKYSKKDYDTACDVAQEIANELNW